MPERKDDHSESNKPIAKEPSKDGFKVSRGGIHSGELNKIIMLKVGGQLKAVRLRKGFSQEELAERTSTNRTYISDIERGISSPTFVFLFRLAAALDTKLWKIIKEIED
jgi:ribosome-binding protein aMBF1 (putative translation factor)